MHRLPLISLLPFLLPLTSVLAELSLLPIPESLPCMRICEEKTDMSNVPLCAINPPIANDDDVSNTISCLCTDRHLLTSTLPCILQSCADDGSAISTYFTHLYTLCHTHGHTTYPSPPHLLRALGITPPPTAIIPTTIAGIPQNSAFPEPAATKAPPPLPSAGSDFINKLAAEAAPTERGSVEGQKSGSSGRVEVGHGMGFAGAGVVGVAVVGVMVLVLLTVF